MTARRRGGRALWSSLAIGVICLGVVGLEGRAAITAQTSPNSLEIRGAGAMARVSRAMAEAYMSDHPDSIVTVGTTATHQGLKSLIIGTCEMAMGTDDMPEDLEKLAKEKVVKLTRTDIYRDALVVAVHHSNPITNLTSAQIKDIFRGAITNWKDVGGEDKPIEVMTLATTSATYEVFKRRVLGDDAVMTPKAITVTGRKAKESVHENTITYCGIPQLVTWNVKGLTVDGIAAGPDTIRSGKYPIIRMLSLYQRSPPTPIGSKLLEYFLSPDKGQKQILAEGNIPVGK